MAKRGYVYEFFDKKKNGGKYALVVSGDDRANDHFLSVIMVCRYNRGSYVVEVEYNGEKHNVNCRMVTYCDSSQLGECVGVVEHMEEVDRKIMSSLGLSKYEYADELLKGFIENGRNAV